MKKIGVLLIILVIAGMSFLAGCEQSQKPSQANTDTTQQQENQGGE